MPTIGTDCDITLSHPSVNGGAAVGFVLERESKQGGRVVIHREAYRTPTDQWADRITYNFRVWIGDEVSLPNAQKSTRTRAEWYELLHAFLAERVNLVLTLLSGVHADLHASLKCLREELSTGKYDVIEVTLNNGGFPELVPIDFVALNASTYDSGIGYDQAYFR